MLNLCRDAEGNLVYCEGNHRISEQEIEEFALKYKNELLPIFRKKTTLFHHQYDDATELAKTRLYYFFRDNTVDFKPEEKEQVTITVQPIAQEPEPAKKVIPQISEKGKQIMELAEFLGKNGISIPANEREKNAVIFKLSELMSKAASSLKLVNSLDFDD